MNTLVQIAQSACNNNKNSVCDRCKNKITVPSSFAVIDVMMMAQHGWDVQIMNEKTIMTQQCKVLNCTKAHSIEPDDTEEMQLA